MLKGVVEVSLDSWVSDSRRRLGREVARCCSTEERLVSRPRMLQKWILKEAELPGTALVNPEILRTPRFRGMGAISGRRTSIKIF